MKIYEIILLVIGICFTAFGYIYSKMKSGHKKAKIPSNYKEYIGICKKHQEKDGKFFEVYEIMRDGKTLKYENPGQDSKDNLKEIDSIEKFYIDDAEPKVVKSVTDFGGGTMELSKSVKQISYITMGIGLAFIIVTLFLVLF